jgi:hypothetical protein
MKEMFVGMVSIAISIAVIVTPKRIANLCLGSREEQGSEFLDPVSNSRFVVSFEVPIDEYALFSLLLLLARVSNRMDSRRTLPF